GPSERTVQQNSAKSFMARRRDGRPAFFLPTKFETGGTLMSYVPRNMDLALRCRQSAVFRSIRCKLMKDHRDCLCCAGIQHDIWAARSYAAVERVELDVD